MSAANTPPASAPEVTFRPATFADKDGILRMLERAFGFPADPARWEWLYRSNTASDSFYCMVAESGGEIVAQYATMPVRLWHAGKELPALYSLETATDPAFQGRGLFRTLAETLLSAAAAERKLLYIFPNLQSAPGFYKKLACIELRPFPVLARPLGNLRAVVAARHRALAPVAALADIIFRAALAQPVAARLRGRLAGARVIRLDDFGPWADTLWDDLRPGLGTCTIRDARFLRWRYCEAPHRYAILGLDRGNGPEGFAVIGVRPWKGGHTADLMELMVRPGDRAGARLLIAEAVLHAASSGAVALRTWATPRHPHLRSLRRALFLPLPGRLKVDYSFGVRLLDPAALVLNEVTHIEDWYMTAGDIEYI